MMKHEFEEIAGYEVSDDDYSNIIEPMYMHCDLDKYEFVKCLNPDRFRLKTYTELIDELSRLATAMFVCNETERRDSLNKEFTKCLFELNDRFDGTYSAFYRYCRTNKNTEPYLYPTQLISDIDNSDIIYL